MSTRLLPRPLHYILAALALALSLRLMVGQSLTTVQAARQSLTLNGESAATTASNTFVVNSIADLPDADVGDGVCAAANGTCTLRAAIMQANFVSGPNTMTVPSGVYLLTRPGDDDEAVLGDLDIGDDLNIQGAGAALAIVDGNGAATGDRVFQILSSAKETSLSGLTIRNGKKVANTFDEGGGLDWEGGGGHLHLSNVVFEGNAARYAGGLSLRYSSAGGSIQLDHVTLHANTATAAGGGLVADFSAALSDFVMSDSLVYSNTAYEGGGLYFQGGLGPFGQALLNSSEIYSNTASLSAAIENHSGDASVSMVVLDSNLHNNHADYYGGAIGNYGTLVISSTTLDANSASMRGGGLYDYEGGQVAIEQSTLSGNSAQSGGGIYSELFIHNSAALTLTNSTLSGNTAVHDGAGLYADGGQMQLFNVTIAGNHVVVPLGTFYPGMGGGLYITATAIVTAQNTLIADNTHRYRILPPEPDDCFGPINPRWYNLIETTNNCTFTGTTFNNITGVDPALGPLQFNGGATQTQAPQVGSPAIDAGQTPFCSAATFVPLTIDQRGWRRPIGARCDIGAVEAGPHVYLPLVQR